MVQELEARISKDPDNPRLFVQAAEVLDGAGFYQKAYTFLAKAQSLDPAGAFLTEFRRRRYNHHDHGGGCSACDALCGLCVLDTCCECMGGDIIECC